MCTCSWVSGGSLGLSFGGVEVGVGAFLYPENGLRMFDFDLFCWVCRSSGIGLAARRVGWKLSSRTMTKFEGKRPMMRLSRLSLPIHHDPSPALRHSIRSPSTNPRSRSVSPPQEYIARHQQGNRLGKSGALLAIVNILWGCRRKGGNGGEGTDSIDVASALKTGRAQSREIALGVWTTVMNSVSDRTSSTYR